VIELDAIISGPRPGRENPAADRVWRELRQKLFAAEYRHPVYDPRRLLDLGVAERVVWMEGRRQWLATVVFAGDERVTI
jgi:hypothetical protein